MTEEEEALRSAKLVLTDRVGVILVGELFPHNFHVFFAQFFNRPDFPNLFFQIYIMSNLTFLFFFVVFLEHIYHK